MAINQGTETVVEPLQKSALNKKGLCDYVINVASGCLHGCKFCYVPSTPVIRARQTYLKAKGVQNPQLDWGQYLFIRQDIPEKLEQTLHHKKTWACSEAGRGVVLLCSGTDPYQNNVTAKITRATVSVLLDHNKRVRILTRSPLWLDDIDLLIHPNVTLGMSLPHLDDSLSRQIEPHAPLPSTRFQALKKGHQQGCRTYVAIAPTPPQMDYQDFVEHLDKVMQFEPEVIFWEPINARGSNGKRMAAAGLDFVKDVMTRDAWAENFIRQWNDIHNAAATVGCLDRLHIWVDAELKSYVDAEDLEYWFYRPTVERWDQEPSKTVIRDKTDRHSEHNRLLHSASA
jgi:DNA repair photolyase